MDLFPIFSPAQADPFQKEPPLPSLGGAALSYAVFFGAVPISPGAHFRIIYSAYASAP